MTPPAPTHVHGFKLEYYLLFREERSCKCRLARDFEYTNHRRKGIKGVEEEDLFEVKVEVEVEIESTLRSTPR